MTECSSDSKPDIGTESGKPSSEDRRDLVIKVRVNAAEKAEIVLQKGRLSLAAFLRDRGLRQNGIYDPTYAAIGGVYQSASNLRDSADWIQEASVNLQNATTVLARLVGHAADSEHPLKAIKDLRELAAQLNTGAERIENQANELGGQARELGQKHMQEMLKRYPMKIIEPRPRR